MITNNNEISKARTYTFDISYTVTSSELRSIKGGYTDENGYFCGTYFNEDYDVSVFVDQNNNNDYLDDGDTNTTEKVYLEVHTDVKTTNTVKTQWKASLDWSDEWGDKPDDYDQYFYIVWKVTSSHDKSSSQKFKITWSEGTVHDGSYVTDYPENHNNNYKGWLQSGTYSWIIVTKHTRNPTDAGWYHSSTWKSYASVGNINNNVTVAANFATDTFSKKNPASGEVNYHLYAKWIPVETVDKDADDLNQIEDGYSGFGLAGVLLRKANMLDPNYNNDEKPEGLRFVTSLSESLYNSIDALSGTNVDGSDVPVEYGYVVGTEDNITAFASHYNVKDLSKYQLRYNGENVNGIDTRGLDENNRTVENDCRYITNVNCTSKVNGVTNGVVAEDHQNYGSYRLYTLVVTYEGDDANSKDKKIAARSYIRYYDANGLLRVFYNTYKKNMYSGCMCSFNMISGMAISQAEPESTQEQDQQTND